MKYSIICYESPSEFATRVDPEKKDAYWTAVEHYFKALREAGVFVAGAGLQAPETATTMRYSNGQRLVQDGPFPDTKEQLGGLFIIDVPNLDVALEWAARFPQEPGRAIEVRPNLLPRE